MEISDLATSSSVSELDPLSENGTSACMPPPAAQSLSWSSVRSGGLSIADQILSVGGMFLVNVALARTQTRTEYGMFALSYSIYTFLSSLHNAAILEPYTVYGSGRYREHFSKYAGLLWRTNNLLGLGLSAAMTLIWLLSASTRLLPAPRAILGMALACGVLMMAAFGRRTFYIRQRPDLAARYSLTFFVSCSGILWLSLQLGILNGFSAFLITALAWSVATIVMVRELPRPTVNVSFTEINIAHWPEHWKYARWVLVTAFVFQFTTQGYFWLVAAFLPIKEVGDLRAMYNLVLPIDQVLAAITLLILPKMCSLYASRGFAGLLPLWKKYGLGWFLASCGFSGLISVLGRPVMHILYAGKFDQLALLMAILAFLPAVMGIGHTLNAALKAAERPNLVFFAYICGGVATLFFGAPMVAHFGLSGAVYGMLMSGAAYSIALAVSSLVVIRAEAKRSAASSARA
jgi:O-antigen/teichoic acid export membrane protein